MNINFGLFWVGEMKIRDKNVRNQSIAKNALQELQKWRHNIKDCMGSSVC